MRNKTSIEKSFIIGLVSLLLIVFAIFISFASIHWGSKIISSIIGLSYLIAAILSVLGSIYFIKGVKSRVTYKTIIAFIINFGVVALFIATIVANINDLNIAYNN